MKKIITLSIISLALTGCSFLQQNQDEANQTQPQTQQETASEFSEIANAIQAGQSVRCTMTHTESGNIANYLVKGEMIKLTGFTQNGQSGNMISDGQTMYTWSDTENTGVMFSIPEGQDPQSAAQEQDLNAPDLSTQEGINNFEDSTDYTLDCEPASIDDSEFTPPSDVEFTDLSAMMEGAQQQMQEGMENLQNIDQQEMQDQAEELMQQFGQ